MDPLRKPFQGLWNVVRFNWHFYLLALVAALGLGLLGVAGPPAARGYASALLGLVLIPVVTSLAVSAYVYDFSDLYRLTWLPTTAPAHPAVLTINAGFDEISAALQRKYAPRQLVALDFYNPARHTEASIARARRAYPPFPGTQSVDTRAALPLPDNSVDLAFAFLAAHEIRDPVERVTFFREIRRITKPTGLVIVTEHLRDTANFLAYNVGFFHFHSRRAWLATFQQAGLRVAQQIPITPFITAFILSPHGSAA
ncbi:class I SAM-dependent methyltransferase [Hymenobacter sp. BT664]|uniref:Class I SAM-dependent methyltransferase n=1 Tax=Hymenobacter montanus TaxID=2771359 RepID=A0A927BCZ4_9BACT|nr:methyltransferase domain-containing protein [Hymenobacter montanus]MBD2767834.1 class I SAM-dependent methyltransferase [Hymenobacter montanus]